METSESHDTAEPTSRKKIYTSPWFWAAVVVVLVIIGIVFVIVSPKTKSAVENKVQRLHSSDEAVKAAADLYNDYLPLKAQTAAKVGDSKNVEPANVQVVRADDFYFTDSFYNQILDDYMKEYQKTGAVTKDDVACAASATYQGASVASSTKTTAVVNVKLKLDDGSTKVIPVTFDLHTLKVSKVAC